MSNTRTRDHLPASSMASTGTVLAELRDQWKRRNVNNLVDSINKGSCNPTEARIGACAFLSIADKAERIAQIAKSKGVDTQTASVIYTLASLNYLVKSGAARDFHDALNQIEERQTGYQANPLTLSEGKEKLLHTVAKINRLNHSGKTTVLREGFTVDPQGNAEKTRFFKGFMLSDMLNTPKRKHRINMGKLLGSLYTMYEERLSKDTPENDFITRQIKQNLQLFFKDYVSNLSERAKRNVYKLARYSGKAKEITSTEALNDPERKELCKIADNLHYTFPHKDAITRPQFVELIQEYVTPPDTAEPVVIA